MKKIGRGGKIVDARPFDSTPDEFADFVNDRWLPSIERGSHAFHPRGYSLIPHLEREAVEALSSLWPNLPQRPVVDAERAAPAPAKTRGRFAPAAAPLLPDTEEAAFERWRVIWATEAQVHRVHAHEYSAEHRAAINILVTASQLRAAVHAGEGEKSAALGMLLAFQAIEGGYSVDVESEIRSATDSAVRWSQEAQEAREKLLPFDSARRTRTKEGKTLEYEKYAALHPKNNRLAVEHLRREIPASDDGSHPFFWNENRMVVDRKTGEVVTFEVMVQQLQKARQRMSKKEA